VDESSARQFNLPAGTRGAVIVKLAPDSPLGAAIEPLDVIHSINGQGIMSAEEAVKALNLPAPAGGTTIGFDRVVRGKFERRSVRLP
jgi:S1-C subfamily serine protease